jgi:ABC-type lipoprotein export system ATPase subunit
MLKTPSLSIFKAGDLLLIEDEKPVCQSNFVKLSLSLLREAGLRPPIQFVTLDSLDQAEQTVSLEALLLQNIQDQNLTSFLEQMSNRKLFNLIQIAGSLQVSLNEATAEQKHIITLALSLLEHKPFVLYDMPEQYLSDKLKNYFFDALFFELQQHKKIAFVRTHMPQVWEPMATKKVILKGHQTSVVPLIKEKIRSRFLEINIPSKETQQEGLVFRWPENEHKKSA